MIAISVAGLLLSMVASLVVGSRVLALWWRTRKLPELLLAVATLCVGFIAYAVGTAGKILVEGPSQRSARGEGQGFQMMGRTRTNLIVNVPVPFGDFWNKRWVGKLATVEIVEVKANTLFGRFA